MRIPIKWLACLVVCSGTCFADLTMYIGAGGANFMGLVHTTGATAGAVTVINTSFPVNGLTAVGSSFLYAGDPSSAILRNISPTGVLNSQVTSNFSNSGCCGESLYYDGTVIWRVRYGTPGTIQTLNPATGNVINSYAQNGKVGITPVNGTLWITNWDTGDVGPWNPTTNTFTPAFNTSLNACCPGALAWDPAASVLWVGNGENNGLVPYTLTGTMINAGIVPFTSGDEIDGLAIFPGATPSGGTPSTTPIPPSWMLTAFALAAVGILFGARGAFQRRPGS